MRGSLSWSLPIYCGYHGRSLWHYAFPGFKNGNRIALVQRVEIDIQECSMILKKYFIAVAFLILFPGYGSISVVAQTDPDKTLSPYFHVYGDPRLDSLPLKDTQVDVAISGVIADVSVQQTYRNEGSRAINATYVFPASTRAAVYGMQMRFRDEIITAKIKEREIAKEEFETAKKEGKSASLLEQERPNVFTMNLANIMPQDQ